MKSLYGIWNIRGRERNEVMKGIELSEKNVRLHVSARDWEEAVRIGGGFWWKTEPQRKAMWRVL